MTATWDNISWIFEPDGALRDIYVQDITLGDWIKLIDFLNSNYKLRFGTTGVQKDFNKIDKDYVIKYLTDNEGTIESKSVTIDFEGVNINCHFFLHDQIEFDIDPREIKSIEDYKKIEGFMISVSKILGHQITLTDENEIKLPLIKIDTNNGINKALTKQEMKGFIEKTNSLRYKIGSMQTRLLMKLFPRRFEAKILKSANEPYKSTNKKITCGNTRS